MTAAATDHRTVERNEAIAVEYADKIRPLLAQARQATGHVPDDHPARIASDEVNQLLMEYFDQDLSIAHLASFLAPDISLAGIRRRVRVSRGLRAAKEAHERGDLDFDYGLKIGSQHKKHYQVAKARELDDNDYGIMADTIVQAREVGGGEYGRAIRAAYNEGASLYKLAELVDRSYYALWAAMRASY